MGILGNGNGVLLWSASPRVSAYGAGNSPRISIRADNRRGQLVVMQKSVHQKSKQLATKRQRTVHKVNALKAIL